LVRKVRTKSMFGAKAIGISVSWEGGQFCLIAADRGIVGCGIFDPEILEEFGMAGALARGTPRKPLKEPEDLLAAKIVSVSSKAGSLGVKKGMTGAQALQKLLAG